MNFNGEEIFVVEGVLQALQTSRTTINLLAELEKNLPAKNLATGISGVVSDMHGIVSNAAALALYDGEDTYHFAGMLDQQVVCGTFEHANDFSDGDSIKAVVSKRKEALFVHAIMHTKTQQFYMPLGAFAGEKALFRHCMKVAWRFTVFLWVIVFGWAFYNEMFSDSYPAEKKLVLFAMITLIPPVLMFPMEFWSYNSFRGMSKYAEVIFKLFGFPRATHIDLRDVGFMSFESAGWKHAWRADLMLKKLNGPACR